MRELLEQIHPGQLIQIEGALATAAMRIVAAIIILLAGWWFSKRVARGVEHLLMRQERMDATLRPVLCDICLWGLRILTIVGALSQLGIETASIVTVLGAAGLAIGLALQGTMQNIAAGIMLLLLRPFRVGDYIDNGAATVAGTVEEIGLFTTRLTKPDGICEYVPNSTLWGSTVRNYSRNPTRRLDLEVEISASDDVARAIETLRQLAASNPLALDDPLPRAMVLRFDDSVVVLNVRVWASVDTYWDLRWILAGQVRKALDEAFFRLPRRVRELHVVRPEEELLGSRE